MNVWSELDGEEINQIRKCGSGWRLSVERLYDAPVDNFGLAQNLADLANYFSNPLDSKEN